MLSMMLLFPLAGFLINGLWYGLVQTTRARSPRSRVGTFTTGTIATLAIAGAFVVALISFVRLSGMPQDARVIQVSLFSWLQAGGFSLDFALRLDPLSSLFSLVITGVGTLITLYSIGYMDHDQTPGKFFAYMNLFCFMMLTLVLGASLPVLFFGWEGVGLCSYLLIGYWYADAAKASAGKKAFIVNRIGDLGFLLGMFLIFSVFGTLDFSALRALLTAGGVLPPGVSAGTVTAMCLLLFVGCVGKSAQIPLYVWLPDAMAGPTPVSALIHAATMVTAGVYLVARTGFLFALSPEASLVVAVVGGVTAFFAATIAIAQTDIKKVLAYSTISQLGYMFLACGVGASAAGVFHVVTHAFFKALLFLGAGSVIHAMHDEQDLRKMGGLRHKMPKTFLVMAAGGLALVGIPPFSGFFSKDEILWRAFSSPGGGVWLWSLGVATAVMTAVYTTRLFALAFLGKARSESRPNESPRIMIFPLQVLAVLSVLGGLVGIPHVSLLEHWLEPVLAPLGPGVHGPLEYVLMAGTAAAVTLAGWLTLRFYADLARAEELKSRLSGLYRVLENKWYVDELYDRVFVRPLSWLARGILRWFDVGVIDNAVLGVARATEQGGRVIRFSQTGSLQVYAIVFMIGLLLTAGYLLYGLV